ncbi:MAG: ACT domain-containing protein [Gemmatimonadetes bacterium]|jgi:hypothetical protein|nr:ACT domain-containing protein [Gemmatimonadota bacterium]MBT5056988.1 ACT domain-containing protein [Gemmatimonadota bacterium]MBT5142241.1 ACT domain-containing protein [Gemmatimonadota bacterium]MBT5589174.1 ACT domain-containing protein [Gemmatimonadota bacterium]MBT5963176.1 ACT domain-containing protein [Gemmatimonadota bacterium]
MREFRLRLLPDVLSVCRLDANDQAVQEAIPRWVCSKGFWSVSRRGDELSVVCDTARVPPELTHQSGWRAFEIDGTLDFSEVGVLAALTSCLAQAGVAVFALSTHDTDVILVQQDTMSTAMEALIAEGHQIISPDPE